jgi:hypothetical protein
MKLNKSELIESIRKLNKERPLKENSEIQRVLPPADVDAREQHEKALEDNAKRKDPENYAKEVKELIKETASEESRYAHFDVVNRKDLAKRINEAKEKGLDFKISRSDREGFRYDFAVLKEEYIKKEAGDPEINTAAFNKATDVQASSPSTGLGEALDEDREYLSVNTRRSCYSVEDCINDAMTVGELIEYLSSFNEDLPVILSFDRGYTYQAVKEYLFETCWTRQNSEESLDEDLSKDEIKNRVKDKLLGVEESQDKLLTEDDKKEIEEEEQAVEEDNKEAVEEKPEAIEETEELEEKQPTGELKVYTSTLEGFEPSERARGLWEEIVKKDKVKDLEYQLSVIFPNGVSVEAIDDMLINQADFISDLTDLDGEPSYTDDEFNDEEVEPIEDEYGTYSVEDDVEPVYDEQELEDNLLDSEDLDNNDEDENILDDEEDIDESLKEAVEEETIEDCENCDEDEDISEKEDINGSIYTDNDDSVIIGDKVKIVYGNSWKEAESNDPVEVDQEVLEQYKDNYSYVRILDDEELDESLKKNKERFEKSEDKEEGKSEDKEVKEAELSEDIDENDAKLAEGFLKSNFKENTLNAEENSIKEDIKESISNSDEDEEIVSVDDELVENMLGMPKQEK